MAGVVREEKVDYPDLWLPSGFGLDLQVRGDVVFLGQGSRVVNFSVKDVERVVEYLRQVVHA